jgi:ABC-type lipoprotein export system ATPase subunit
MRAAVELHDAFRIFHARSGANVALQGLTLEIDPGEIVVVLGPSGSGKTTLLQIISGFESLSAGTARVFGIDLDRLSRKESVSFRSQNLGYLDQHYVRALSPYLTCRQTVALQLSLRGHTAWEAGRIADDLLRRVGLEDRRHDQPELLSGGEQQRVALCAALAHRPRLLLADEPAGELDLESATTVYRLLAEIAREVHATALVVSHDPAAAAIADRIVHIRDGRVVEESVPGGSPALVVSRGGWVRLPIEPKERRLMTLARRDGELVLRALDGESQPHSEERATATRGPDREVVAELREIQKSYGERVLFDGLSHSFASGRLTAVVGRSGVGKTTLLHLLAGLDRPNAGEVVVLGEPLGEKNRSQLAALRRQSIGLVTQEPGLVPYLSVSENVGLSFQLRGVPITKSRVRGALDAVGLAERADQRVSTLSAGERQRVAIARALAANVAMLLLDEPTARLDEEHGRDVARRVEEAAEGRGLAVVCATHDPALIERAAEIIALEQPSPLDTELPVVK